MVYHFAFPLYKNLGHFISAKIIWLSWMGKCNSQTTFFWVEIWPEVFTEPKTIFEKQFSGKASQI